ncbi:MAG: hypothetical protein OEZ58_01670 [Gammaproteobacteria bacterium]|nr:hypothetical protein [Gammaproteobacteria bacterium]MDH5727669.1 hypothetical protein [Gammaproteobacteria bacterium]
MDILEHPRYKDKPAIVFFENLVLDIIGHLPDEKRDNMQKLNLQSVFQTQSSDWREVVTEVFRLSDTIDICILNEWIQRYEAGEDIPARQFAQQFVDDYFDDAKQLDVWTEESFCEAISRIERNVAKTEEEKQKILATSKELQEIIEFSKQLPSDKANKETAEPA